MTEHYFSKKPTSVFKPEKVRMRLKIMEIELYTAGGVFSPKKLDLGTKLLIENATLKKGWKVLDFGCGYGVLGIVLKRLNPSIDVVMSDVNFRSVKLSEMNARLHKLEVEVFQSDVFQSKRFDGRLFDTIFLNPPQTAGKKVCFKMIEESKLHIVSGGLLQLVARHQKGGKMLSKKMEEVFGNVSDAAKGSGFRVYVSEKKD